MPPFGWPGRAREPRLTRGLRRSKKGRRGEPRLFTYGMERERGGEERARSRFGSVDKRGANSVGGRMQSFMSRTLGRGRRRRRVSTANVPVQLYIGIVEALEQRGRPRLPYRTAKISISFSWRASAKDSPRGIAIHGRPSASGRNRSSMRWRARASATPQAWTEDRRSQGRSSATGFMRTRARRRSRRRFSPLARPRRRHPPLARQTPMTSSAKGGRIVLDNLSRDRERPGYFLRPDTKTFCVGRVHPTSCRRIHAPTLRPRPTSVRPAMP